MTVPNRAKVVAVVVLTTASLFAASMPALSQQPQNPPADVIDRVVTVVVGPTSGEPAGGTPPGSGSTVTEYETEFVPPPPYEADGDFVLRLSCGPDAVWLERAIFTTHQDRSVTKQVLYSRCVDIVDIDTSGTPPTMTPDIAGEIVKRVLPLPTPQVNPTDYAVTQIETWVWYGDDGSLAMTFGDHDGDAGTPETYYATVTASDAAGFNTVTATVWISEYVWDMGDGGKVRSTTPGSEESPAGEHLYTSTSESNEVLASTVWRGTWSSQANGVANGSGNLGPVTVTGSPRSYPVYQIRSVPAPSGR